MPHQCAIAPGKVWPLEKPSPKLYKLQMPLYLTPKDALKTISRHARHPTEYTSMRMLINFLARNIPLDSKICDVGSGLGQFPALLADIGYKDVTGIDSSPYLKSVRRGFEFKNIPLNEFSPSNFGRFDLVLAVDVLEHARDDRAFLGDISRMLRPGGWLVIVTPAHPSLYCEFDLTAGHFRRYDKPALERLLGEDYHPVRIRTMGRYLLLFAAGFFRPASPPSEEDLSAALMLEENTRMSFELTPPAFYHKIRRLLPYAYGFTYALDAHFSRTPLGTEYFVTAQRR